MNNKNANYIELSEVKPIPKSDYLSFEETTDLVTDMLKKIFKSENIINRILSKYDVESDSDIIYGILVASPLSINEKLDYILKLRNAETYEYFHDNSLNNYDYFLRKLDRYGSYRAVYQNTNENVECIFDYDSYDDALSDIHKIFDTNPNTYSATLAVSATEDSDPAYLLFYKKIDGVLKLYDIDNFEFDESILYDNSGITVSTYESILYDNSGITVSTYELPGELFNYGDIVDIDLNNGKNNIIGICDKQNNFYHIINNNQICHDDLYLSSSDIDIPVYADELFFNIKLYDKDFEFNENDKNIAEIKLLRDLLAYNDANKHAIRFSNVCNTHIYPSTIRNIIDNTHTSYSIQIILSKNSNMIDGVKSIISDFLQDEKCTVYDNLRCEDEDEYTYINIDVNLDGKHIVEPNVGNLKTELANIPDIKEINVKYNN